ncbi:MAG: class B sortase [Oscillospiraceae bacterium]|nr:class B sortase [Oscillospiraceae bacterium]
MKKILLKIILCVCILAIVTFSVLIIREIYIDWQSRTFFSDIAEQFERRPDAAPPGYTEPGGTQPGQPGQPEQPDDTGTWVPFVNFEALNELFTGVVGWIRLSGTPIDYMIMQSTDNDYFLTRLPDGTTHRNGSIFLDYRNNSDFSDKSILIYGHETRAGDMFGVLKNYRNQEFYDANPRILLYTPEKDFTIEIFAGNVVHSVRDHPPLHFENDEEFLNYINQLKRTSVFSTDVQVSPNDRIVSLVTCTYDFDDARLIIVGRLVE